MELEHEADVAIAEGDEIGVGHLGDAVIADVDGAGIRAIQAAQQMQQRALADAGGAHDRDHLAALHREREIAQHLQATVGDRVGLGDAGGSDKRHRLLVAQRLRGVEPRGLP